MQLATHFEMEYIMKISEFAKIFNINKSTVRYYTDINLLIPNKKKGYFDYDDRCKKDLENIIHLKSIGFLIKEIQLLQAYKKFRKVYLLEEREHLYETIDNKIISLESQLENIKNQIEGLKRYKNNISIEMESKSIGLPFQILNHLSCAKCNSDLSTHDANIYNNMIYSGNLICTCGSVLWIRDGVIVDDLEYYEKMKERESENHVKKASMDTITNDHILQIMRSGECIADFMGKIDCKKGVLFSNADSDLLIMDTNKIFREGGLYIFVSYDYTTLIDLKKRLKKIGLKGNFAFLCISNKFPMKKSIKYVIDNGGNICDLIRKKESNHTISKLSSLISGESMWLSMHVGLKMKDSKLKSNDYRSDYLIMEKYLNELRNYRMEVEDQIEVGSCKPPIHGDLYKEIDILNIRALILRTAE